MTGTIEFGSGETVERLVWSAGPKDGHGKSADVYTSVPVAGVGVDVPEFPGQMADQNDRQLLDLTLFLPVGMSTSKRDMFIVRGLKYKAVNDGVAVINAFTGDGFPTPVAIRRVTG